MGPRHCKHDSVMQTKPSNKRCPTCPDYDGTDIQDEPAQSEPSKLSLHTSSPVQHEIEKVQSIPPTSLDTAIPEESETADLVTPDPLIPDPLTTPDPVAPDKSIWATFRRYLFGVSVRKGGGRNHIDHHCPEPKGEEEKPTKGVNAEMAAKRSNKVPKCKYGTHRSLDQPRDDVENKKCKFHRKKLTEEKKLQKCE